MRTMPAIWGVFSCSTVWFILRKPKATMVARWLGGRLMTLRTWVILIRAMIDGSAVKYFRNFYPTGTSYLLRIAQLVKRHERGLDQVVRVG